MTILFEYFTLLCYLITVPIAPVAVILLAAPRPSPKFRSRTPYRPPVVIHAALGNEVQAFQGYDACRHQVAGGEEAVLQV